MQDGAVLLGDNMADTRLVHLVQSQHARLAQLLHECNAPVRLVLVDNRDHRLALTREHAAEPRGEQCELVQLLDFELAPGRKDVTALLTPQMKRYPIFGMEVHIAEGLDPCLRCRLCMHLDRNVHQRPLVDDFHDLLRVLNEGNEVPSRPFIILGHLLVKGLGHLRCVPLLLEQVDFGVRRELHRSNLVVMGDEAVHCAGHAPRGVLGDNRFRTH